MEVDPEAIARAAAVLRRGGLVAMPTETVYGLAADAGNAQAIRAVFAAKGRPTDHPVIVHVADAAAMDDWAQDTPAAHTLARAFWPGPLTLVLRRRTGVSDLITGGQDTVAVRCPAHPWAQALLRAFGGAVVAPSANRYGRISPTRAEHVASGLGLKPAGAVDLILDGGPCSVGIESTIVDISGPVPRLLRPGAIAAAQLAAALGRPVAQPAADDRSAPRAPGRLARHYAPRTPLVIVPPAELAATVRSLAPRSVSVLAPAWAVQAEPNVRLHLLPQDRPDAYARQLYELLHQLDASGADRLLVAEPPDDPAWLAVRDRLIRAAAGSAA
jgi:L-threonylcarbamoyladenylate synthase